MREIPNFTLDLAKRGQEVTQEVYESFLNVATPISLRSDQGYMAGFQVGEAVTHKVDTRIGKYRSMHATFATGGGRYYYLGVNFRGEVDSRDFEGQELGRYT